MSGTTKRGPQGPVPGGTAFIASPELRMQKPSPDIVTGTDDELCGSSRSNDALIPYSSGQRWIYLMNWRPPPNNRASSPEAISSLRIARSDFDIISTRRQFWKQLPQLLFLLLALRLKK